MRISLTTVVVPDCDVAIEYYVDSDTRLDSQKRWVVVSPSADGSHGILLAKATSEQKQQCIGNQTGGRVAFFLETKDFHATHTTFCERGVEFTEVPRNETYGIVAVFTDIFGNRWDLIEPRTSTLGNNVSGQRDG
jgi:predicted enzyme related to lactoylglutathione lyase